MLNRILAVDSLHKEPVLIDHIHFISVQPIVTTVHQVTEELLLHFRVTNLESNLCQQVNRLTVHSTWWEFAYQVKQNVEEWHWLILLMLRVGLSGDYSID